MLPQVMRQFGLSPVHCEDWVQEPPTTFDAVIFRSGGWNVVAKSGGWKVNVRSGGWKGLNAGSGLLPGTMWIARWGVSPPVPNGGRPPWPPPEEQPPMERRVTARTRRFMSVLRR